MEIALFGGSFDPPHVGHLLAAQYVLAVEPVDELWLLPVFAHPFAKRMHAPFEHRAALCELLAAQLGPRVRVCRLEQQQPGLGRTVDLLEHLRRERPEDRFALVLGSDLAADRPQWKRFERVLELARLIELRRGGFDVAEVPGVVLPAVSSSQVRQLLLEGKDASRLVPRAVLAAIAHAGTYREA